MSVKSVVATQGAPVSVTDVTLLAGFNSLWVQADPGEVITVSVGGGGQTADMSGRPTGTVSSYNANMLGRVDPPIRICLPALNNMAATVPVAIVGQSGATWQLAILFSALAAGKGKFLWQGAATGAPAGPEHYCTLFLDIDQTSAIGAMPVVAACGATDSVILPDASSVSFRGIQPVGGNGCAMIRVQDTAVEAVIIRCSLPNSADGEILPVQLFFTPVFG